jgi:hypothetical protein
VPEPQPLSNSFEKVEHRRYARESDVAVGAESFGPGVRLLLCDGTRRESALSGSHAHARPPRPCVSAGQGRFSVGLTGFAPATA